MSDLDPLIEFLLARIAEDEEAAQGAAQLTAPAARGVSPVPLYELNEWATPETANFGVRWDPARVLAECEAKREMVADLQEELANQHDPEPTTLQLAERMLLTLALPYADHPDYRQEWKP